LSTLAPCKVENKHFPQPTEGKRLSTLAQSKVENKHFPPLAAEVSLQPRPQDTCMLYALGGTRTYNISWCMAGSSRLSP